MTDKQFPPTFDQEWLCPTPGVTGSLERPVEIYNRQFMEAMEANRKQTKFKHLTDLVVVTTRLKLFLTANSGNLAVIRETVTRVVTAVLADNEDDFVAQNTQFLIEQAIQEILNS